MKDVRDGLAEAGVPAGGVLEFTEERLRGESYSKTL
jgi:hypothetical protein